MLQSLGPILGFSEGILSSPTFLIHKCHFLSLKVPPHPLLLRGFRPMPDAGRTPPPAEPGAERDAACNLSHYPNCPAGSLLVRALPCRSSVSSSWTETTSSSSERCAVCLDPCFAGAQHYGTLREGLLQMWAHVKRQMSF